MNNPENVTMRTRRDFIASMSLAGGATAVGWPAFAGAKSEAQDHEHDWDWLLGNWDVWHRRLKDRLAGSDEWEEFTGKSAFWRTMAGLGNVDDNSLEIPSGSYRGLSMRAFDAKSGKWAIWWLDG